MKGMPWMRGGLALALVCMLLTAGTACADTAQQEIVDTVLARAEEVYTLARGDVVYAENNIDFYVNDCAYIDDTASVFYRYVVVSVSLRNGASHEMGLIMYGYNFMLLDMGMEVFYEPDMLLCFDENGEVRELSFPYEVPGSFADVLLCYRVPSYAAENDFALLQTNLFGGKPAGPVYAYAFRL